MNDIKARIKSVQSTMQITKAMELVATSKLRRAKERVERARPFYQVLGSAIKSIKESRDTDSCALMSAREVSKTLYVVIAGDRGLAGGYNSNIFRMTAALSQNKSSIILPIGKKATEHYKAKKSEIFYGELDVAADVGVGNCFAAGEAITEGFLRGDFDKVVLVYTKFVSMMTQLPVYEELLPLSDDAIETEKSFKVSPLIEEDMEEMLYRIIPQYIGGIIWSAICESVASESGARRSAMSAANKNASEMIDTLMLRYNRARQAVITQEITEIVSGAEAL